MKKSLIALAITATAAAPMAASAAMLQAAGDQSGINLYGSFRTQILSQDHTHITDGGSRYGIKGSHDLGNGQSAFYRLEEKFSTGDASFPEGGRLAYAGFKGNWGAFAGGQQWTPYYNVVGSPSDVFASAGVQNYAGPFRVGNAFTYALPGGMPIGGALLGRIDPDETDDLDTWSLGLTADAGPVRIGFGYNDNAPDEDSLVGLSIGGNFGGAGVTLMVEDTGDTNPWALTGTFAGFALQFSDDDGAADSQAWTLGYTYKVGSQSRLQFAYESDDANEDDRFVARLRVDF